MPKGKIKVATDTVQAAKKLLSGVSASLTTPEAKRRFKEVATSIGVNGSFLLLFDHFEDNSLTAEQARELIKYVNDGQTLYSVATAAAAVAGNTNFQNSVIERTGSVGRVFNAVAPFLAHAVREYKAYSATRTMIDSELDAEYEVIEKEYNEDDREVSFGELTVLKHYFNKYGYQRLRDFIFIMQSYSLDEIDQAHAMLRELEVSRL